MKATSIGIILILTYLNSIAQVDTCYQNRVFEFIKSEFKLFYVDTSAYVNIENYIDVKFNNELTVLDTNYQNFEDSVNSILFKLLQDNHVTFKLRKHRSLYETNYTDYHSSSLSHLVYKLSRFGRILKSKKKHLRVKKGKEITISKADYIKSIGYIRVDAFIKIDSSIYTTLLHSKKACRKTKKSDTLIIDLRGNEGGHIGSVNSLLGHFEESQHDTLVQIFDKFQQDTVNYVIPKRRISYKNPMIYIIIDNETFSAADVFTYYLKMNCNALIIGEENEGYSQNGNTYWSYFNDDCTKRFDAWLSIPTSGVCQSDIYNWLKSDGIKPDIKCDCNASIEEIIKMIRT